MCWPSSPLERPSRASAARRTILRLRFAPAKSSGPCKGQNPRRGRAVTSSVGSLGSKVSQESGVSTRDRSGSEVGAIPPRPDHHDGRHLGHVPPSTSPSRGRSNAHGLRPLCLVDRVPNPIPRPREGRCDRRSVEPGDKRCPGVFEPGLRSPPPHRWRATPRLTGLSGRCACIRSGSLRRTQRTDRTRVGHHRRAFPVLLHGVSHHAMRAALPRAAKREDRSSDSKVDRSRRQEKHHRGMRPRVVISSAEP